MHQIDVTIYRQKYKRRRHLPIRSTRVRSQSAGCVGSTGNAAGGESEDRVVAIWNCKNLFSNQIINYVPNLILIPVAPFAPIGHMNGGEMDQWF